MGQCKTETYLETAWYAVRREWAVANEVEEWDDSSMPPILQATTKEESHLPVRVINKFRRVALSAFMEDGTLPAGIFPVEEVGDYSATGWMTGDTARRPVLGSHSNC